MELAVQGKKGLDESLELREVVLIRLDVVQQGVRLRSRIERIFIGSVLDLTFVSSLIIALAFSSGNL